MLLSRKLLFYQNLFPKEYYVSGDYQTLMLPGVYEVIVRDAGGAGGASGGVSNDAECHSGVGGAGGSGTITKSIIKIQEVTTANIHVGAGGKTFANGGNGGDYGRGGAGAGAGGGGGEPSYVVIDNKMIYGNDAGSGGGGGGGASWRGRNSDGGGGGGGGGYYRIVMSNPSQVFAKRRMIIGLNENNEVCETSPDLGLFVIEQGEELYVGKTWDTSGEIVILDAYTIDSISDGNIVISSTTPYVSITPGTITNVYDLTLTIQSVPGKKGSNYNNDHAGVNGVTGNTAQFPRISSGGGGAGVSEAGSYGAYGGGASGGSGGDAGNHSEARSGGGGGGAAGSYNGFGGSRSYNDSGTQRGGGNASNIGTTPIDTTEENALYGITGNYGTGGTTNTNGIGGCVVIRMVGTASTIWDLGILYTMIPTSSESAGMIDEQVEEYKDAGSVTGTVESISDASGILVPTQAEVMNLGDLGAVTERINCGTII